MTPEVLSRLSALLDQALDLDGPSREAWLAILPVDDAELAPTLRRLLARQAAKETGDLFERPPSFTIPAGVDCIAAAFYPGDTVGPYRLQRELGHGGMAVVWLATRADGAFQRQVALKLPQVSRMRPDLGERFARERDILAKLEHPNIARFYDAGVSADAVPYLAMEFVEGEPLTQYCDKHALSLSKRLEVFLQILDAMQYAHANLVIHRDLKPSNILVNGNGNVRVLDFGIAKLVDLGDQPEVTALTRGAGRALTMAYASPEQVRGEPLSTASDVYSLGVVLYELLTGSHPYRLPTKSPAQLEAAIVGTEPTHPSQAVKRSDDATELARCRSSTPARLARELDGDLGSVLRKALAKDIEQRYDGCAALRDDLQRYLHGHPVRAQPESIVYLARKFIGRNRLAVVSVGGVLVAVFFGAGLALWQAGVARDQARLARHQEDRALAVQDFLLGLFRANADAQPDPVSARETTARQLLDLGAARVREQLKHSPAVQDAVLGTLADLYADVGLDQEAADLSAESVVVRERLYGPDDPRVAAALLDYAKSLGSTADAARVPELLLRARRIAEQASGDQTALRISILFGQAQAYRYADVSLALDFAREARSLIDRTGVARADLRRSLYLEGLTLGFLGECAQALTTLQQAHSLSLASPGPVARWQIPEFTAISAQALCLGDFALAESSLIEALEISQRLNGPEHIDTAHVLTRLMRVYLDTSRAAEARALDERMTGLLGQRVVQENVNLNTTLLRSSAMHALEVGSIDKAESRSAELVRRLQGFAGPSVVLAGALQQHARALAAQGRMVEARRRLDEAIAMMHAALGQHARPVIFASMQIDLAALQLWNGDAAAALRELDAVTDVLRAAPAEARPLTPRHDRWRAAALRQAGRAEEAVGAAQTGLDALRTNFRPVDLPRLQADLLLEQGLAFHEAQQFARSHESLTRAMLIRHANDDEASAWRARVEIALAETTLALGDRRTAQRFGLRGSWASGPAPHAGAFLHGPGTTHHPTARGRALRLQNLSPRGRSPVNRSG